MAEGQSVGGRITDWTGKEVCCAWHGGPAGSMISVEKDMEILGIRNAVAGFYPATSFVRQRWRNRRGSDMSRNEVRNRVSHR